MARRQGGERACLGEPERVVRCPAPTTNGEGDVRLLPATGTPERDAVVFLVELADDFDCDEDAHRHGTMCRACRAKEILISLGHDSMLRDAPSDPVRVAPPPTTDGGR